MQRIHQLLLSFSLIALLNLSGCGGGSHPDPKDTVSVSGTVKLDGKPLQQAEVMFIPVEGTHSESLLATTDQKGHYELSLVPPQEYKVHVDRMLNGGPNPALKQYQGENTSLRAEVTKEKTTFDFDLKR